MRGVAARADATPRQASIWRVVARYGVLIAIAVAMVGPILWLFSTALKSPSENIFTYPPPSDSSATNPAEFLGRMARQPIPNVFVE